MADMEMLNSIYDSQRPGEGKVNEEQSSPECTESSKDSTEIARKETQADRSWFASESHEAWLKKREDFVGRIVQDIRSDHPEYTGDNVEI
jgi:hypothetical protein